MIRLRARSTAAVVAAMLLLGITRVRAQTQTVSVTATAKPTVPPTPAPIPEPSPAFGRVIYRANKAASYETLGITMIMCRHRDPEPRVFAVEFFDLHTGRTVSVFGRTLAQIPAGKKVLFVTEGSPFHNRELIDMRLAHLPEGTARVISDARIVHCMAKIRFDPGVRAKSYWRSVGFTRAGVGATPAPVDW